MMVSNNRRLNIVLIFIVCIAVLLASSSRDIYKELSSSIRIFNEVYKQLMVNYVDPIEVGKFTDVSIKKMLKELDPYTVFLSAEEREPLDMMTKGEYGGVGLRISMKGDTLTVISPMDGTPASRAGIFPGDQIIMIDSTSTVGMDIDKAARMIRGQIGTEVKLTIKRFGIPEEMVFTLKRERIKVQDVSYSGFVEDGIGYIRLSGFSKGAFNEIRGAISELSKGGNLKSLIFDLRGNPGGLLEEALDVAEVFTEVGDTLLYTRGRTPQSNRFFISKRRAELSPEIKVAVLVDRGSASASEIVAGIIQDIDRGVVIGSQTFGKGLVQTVYTIDRDHSLKVTTAKYYVPSGRLIQKPNYISNRELVQSIVDTDSIYFSRNGRRLKGSGGIIPDIEIEPESLSPLVQELWRQNLFYSFAVHYKSRHPEIKEPIKVDDKMYEEFRSYLEIHGFKYSTKNERELNRVVESIMKDKRFHHLKVNIDPFYSLFDSIKTEEFSLYRDQIKDGIKSELATLVGGISGRVKANIDRDIAIRKAIDILTDEYSYNVMLGHAPK